jgi:hypothetical protein
MSLSGTTRQLSGIGVDLGARSIAWGTRPDIPPAMTITSRDRRILATVENLRYLTTSMIALLFWGRQTSAAHVRLKLLHDAGYLDKLRPRVSASNASREWIYRLSQRGWDDIVAHDDGNNHEPYRPADLTSISYLEHDLQLNALLLHIAALAASEHGWEQDGGGLIDHIPFKTLGPRAGVIDPKREVRATNASAAANLGNRRVRHEAATAGRLEPDATLLGTDSEGRQTGVMIEYDRTQRPAKQIPKLRRYDHFLTAGWRDTRYAELDIEPAVIFVCTNDAQIPAFVREADRCLTAWHADPKAPRSVGEHIGREQVAITSRSRLLRSDWRVSQVPPLPQHVNPGSKRERRSVEAVLAIPHLFSK